MAARKTRQPPAETTSESSATALSAEKESSSAERPSRLRIAAAVFVLWFAGLAALALWTANPVTLNRDQLLRADVVVEATVTDVTAGECKVLASWPTGMEGQAIAIMRLEELPVKNAERYFFALERDPWGFSVVRTRQPEGARLVYPATDSARKQLAETLENE